MEPWKLEHLDSVGYEDENWEVCAHATRRKMDFVSEVAVNGLTNDVNTETCRLCGKLSENFASIFEDNNMYIAEKISRCLPIIVLSNDQLPSYVCMPCIHSLNISYRLIVTSVKVDALLRKQLLDTQETEDIKPDGKQSNQLESKYHRSLSLRELKEIAINGPANCELCNINFKDINLFDEHMKSIHLLPWSCNLCDNSYDTSKDLILHKTIDHKGTVIVCKQCSNLKDCDNKPKSERFCTVEAEVSSDAQTFQTEFSQQSKEAIFLTEIEKTKQNFLFLCHICKIGFGDEKHYVAHNEIHKENTKICCTCYKECTSIYDLFLHKREEHNMYKKVQLKYVCEKCGRFFTNSWKWESHKGNSCTKKNPSNQCKYCKSIFSRAQKLNRHLRKHKNEMLNDPDVVTYKCVACPKVFVDKEFYQQHRNVHDPACWDKFRCSVCKRSFRDSARLREHKLSFHEGVKLHKCDVCSRAFYRLSSLKVHRVTHFGHKCNNCDSAFKKNEDLNSHMKEDHGLEPNKKLLAHKKSDKTTNYVCRYCGKKLATYQSVVNHEYIHTGEKPYTCKICHKAFRSYTTRWSHYQRHKKGSFICEFCGKCFDYKKNLTVHIQTHIPIEERKHQCTRCGKRFLRKCYLNVHMRIHDGVRPYTCDICSFSFTQLGDMKRHRMRHMKGEIRFRNMKRRPIKIVKSENSE
ncbi:zinc finger protein 260-like [Prorops nasuta]|uniref:zinc finger protein 260-like n=1 Tax=Prorops nasuta TaxID=863751 RepID=UPI0034CFC8F1